MEDLIEMISLKTSKGKYNCLVAMHCLDEGVDIPSASKAILLCNSTNPREFVQRLGRVLRRYPGKNKADIYDLIIKPNFNKISNHEDLEKRIYEKELERFEMIADAASNGFEIYNNFYE